MRRRVRWVVIVVAALVIAGAVAAFVVVKPDLEAARDRVDLRWTPLREPLDVRYQALAAVAAALDAAGAADRAVTLALDDALARWAKLALRGPKHTNPTVEATTANELEAIARRLRANIAASTRLATNPAVTSALLTFDQSVVPVPTITAYNRVVRRYEDERSSTLHRIVADAFGYEPRSLLILG